MALSGVRQYVRDNREVLVGLSVSTILNLTIVAGLCYFAILNYLSAYGARFPGEGVEFFDFILYGQAAWVTAFHAAIFLVGVMFSLSNDVLKPNDRRARPDILFIAIGALILGAFLSMAAKYYRYESLPGRVLLLLGAAYQYGLTFLTSLFGTYQAAAYQVLHGLLTLAGPIFLSVIAFRIIKQKVGAYAFIPILVSLQAVFWLNNDAFADILRWTKYGGGLRVEALLYTGQTACDVTLSGQLVMRTKTTIVLIDDNKDLIEIETKNVCRLRYLDNGAYRREFKLGSKA